MEEKVFIFTQHLVLLPLFLVIQHTPTVEWLHHLHLVNHISWSLVSFFAKAYVPGLVHINLSTCCSCRELWSIAMFLWFIVSSWSTKGVAGQKGGVPKHGRRGKKSTTTNSKQITTTERISVTPSVAVSPITTLTNCSIFESFNIYTNPYSPSPSQQPPHFSPPSSSLWGLPSHSPHGMQPYWKMLTKQIKVCKGCRLGYGNEVSVPDPPYNMCCTWRVYCVTFCSLCNKNSCSLLCCSYLHLDKVWNAVLDKNREGEIANI